MIARWAAVVALAALAACHTRPTLPDPTGPIRITYAPVPLNPSNPAQATVGPFRYAGGLNLTSPDTHRLHGLSDLAVSAANDLVAQGDEGEIFHARLVLDAQGRLAGLAAGVIGRLTGPDGQGLVTKQHTDAEGLAVLPDGSQLVSFERDNRILRYPPGGGAPAAAPFPPAQFEENRGVEAVAAFPASGPDAYLAGGEDGRVWLCRLSAACTPLPTFLPPPADYGLSGLAVLPIPGPPVLAVLHRAFDPLRGTRVLLTLVRLEGPIGPAMHAHVLAQLPIVEPLTRDNLEGVAAVPGPGGAVRLYLISDDNFNPGQRTLLLAFDWMPPGGAPP